VTNTKVGASVDMPKRWQRLLAGLLAGYRVVNDPAMTLVGLVLIGGLLLTSCSETMWRRRSPDFQRVPSYPNARNEQAGAWQRCTRKGCFGEERRMSFETDDPPAVVLAYYDRTLPQEGWMESESTTKLPAYLYLQGCPFYVITIEATRSRAMSTTVEAILAREGCR
jgi:hypothetical protein